MSEVFISYSRKDKVFVQKLNDSLDAIGRDAWVDWEGIPVTAEWWQEIQKGIEEANTFIFVLSPNSIQSKVCRDEVEYAVSLNKRLIPVVSDSGFDSAAVHPSLAKINYQFFREEDVFEKSFLSLVKALDTDLDHVRMHTRILQRALEWEKQNRTSDFLLRGTDYENAQNWQGNCLAQKKSPPPTDTIMDYIATSKTHYDKLKKAEQYDLLLNEAMKEYVRPYLVKEKKRLEDAIKELDPYNKPGFLSMSTQAQTLKQELGVVENFLGESRRWHPREAAVTGNTGARYDYVDVYTFPCCGKSVATDNNPSRFRADGCEEAPDVSRLSDS